MNYRRLSKILKKAGCKEILPRKGGSHRLWYNPSTGIETNIPDWGSKDLKKGTLETVIKRLGIDV